MKIRSAPTIRPLFSAILGLLLILGCVGPPLPHLLPEASWVPEEERVRLDLSGVLKSLDGEDVSLAQFHPEGSVLFLNFWATWCLPCQEEMPAMASLYEQLAEQGFAMVAVSDEDPDTVGRFMEQYPYPFTVLLDPENILGERFGVLAIPTTIVVDGEGRLALRQSGAMAWDSSQMIEQFSALLPKH